MKESKQRSTQQNKTMHKYFQDVANECESQGVTRQTVVNDLGDARIPVTATFIKEVVWKHHMIAMFGKESTAQLTVQEMTELEKVVTLHLREHYGLQTEWGSVEMMLLEQDDIY